MRTFVRRRFPLPTLVLLGFAAIAALPAQDRAERANWRQADKFAGANLRKFVYSTSVTPTWIGKSERFWYSYRTSAGTQYWIVDAELRVKKPLFDHVALATAISMATHKPQQAWQLDLGGPRVDDAGSKLEFSCEGRRFEYELATGKLTDKGPAPRQAERGRRGGEGLDREELRQRFEERFGDRIEQQEQEQQQQQQQEEQQQQEQQEQQQEQQQQGQRQDGQERTERGVGRRGGQEAGRQRGGERDVRVLSPDGRAYVIVREHDLYLVEGTEQPPEAQPVVAPVAANAAQGAGALQEGSGAAETAVRAIAATDNGLARGSEVALEDATGAKLETGRLDVGKVEGGEHEAVRVDTGKLESARSEVVEMEGAKGGIAEAATRVVAAKAETATVETAKVEAANSETVKLETAKAETAEAESGSAAAAKTEGAADAARAGGTDADSTKVATTSGNGGKVEETIHGAGQTAGAVKTSAASATDTAQSSAVKAVGEPAAAPASTAPKAPRIRFDEAAAMRLTTDSAERYSFAAAGRSGRRGGLRGGQGSGESAATAQPAPARARANATWSKDSKAFFATRRDSRGVQELFLVDSLGEPRPTLQTYPYAMPGEATVAHSELWVFDRESKKLRRVEGKWTHESYQDVHFFGDGHELRFVRRDRLQRNAELCALDPATGAVRVLLSETIEDATLALQNVRYLEKRKHLVWWSERSGWGHFYLHDAGSGALVNPITSGTFRAGRLLEIDEEAGVVWLRANGREPNENIYHEHLYRVALDGTDMLCLDPGDASHNSRLSPSRRYIVDTFSRVDLAPRSVLRSGRDGAVLLELEVADLSKLTEMGWQMPERFTVEAADGVTDLYGNLWKPFDFDASRRYPVIVNVYPGPQQEGVTHTFSATASTQQLAQLGFVVIQVGHRGGTPARDKAYGAHGFGNLRDYGLEDKKAAIEQLADRFPFVDITRVGIYGHSGGGFMSAAALLKPPYNRFFKVAVASAGNHDNNIYNASWSERWHGLSERAAEEAQKAQNTVGAAGSATGQDAQTARTGQRQEQQQQQRQEGQQQGGRRGRGNRDEQQRGGGQSGEQATAAANQSPFAIKVPTNAELAANLEGKLLLVHGEIDNNVHPANTMRLVDALIKANKRFDMLIIPGARHSFGAAQEYFRQRMFEYFAEHLLGDCQRGADITRKDK